jgi:hypothetical protein
VSLIVTANVRRGAVSCEVRTGFLYIVYMKLGLRAIVCAVTKGSLCFAASQNCFCLFFTFGSRTRPVQVDDCVVEVTVPTCAHIMLTPVCALSRLLSIEKPDRTLLGEIFRLRCQARHGVELGSIGSNCWIRERRFCNCCVERFVVCESRHCVSKTLPSAPISGPVTASVYVPAGTWSGIIRQCSLS